MPLLTLAGSNARTTTGSGSALPGSSGLATLRAQLDVTAATGTGPTLDVFLEDTIDGTNYNTIATFTQLAAAGRLVVNVTTPFSDTIRARWAIGGGTPSFTFSVIAWGE